MKIFLVSDNKSEESTFYFVDKALRRLGHQTRTFYWWPKLSTTIGGASRFKSLKFLLIRKIPYLYSYRCNRAARQLLAGVHEYRPDFVMVSKGDSIPPWVVKEISIVAPVANWFPDALFNIENDQVFQGIANYDFFFVKDRYLQKQLEKAGFQNIHYLPQSFDPGSHVKAERLTGRQRKQYECDIAFLGSQYQYRTRLIKELLKHGYHIKIWGAGWNMLGSEYEDVKRCWMGRVAIGEEKKRVFRGAKIIMNEQHYSEVLGVNKRTYELAGAGVFQLTGKSTMLPGHSGLEELFSPGEEIICFEDFDDLLKKIDYYLADEAERKRISANALKRAHAEHTYEHRMKKLLSILSSAHREN